MVFKTNAESMTALTGGHIDMVVSSLSSAGGQVKRAPHGSSASHRRAGLSGDFASAPTLAEQGLDTGLSSWRAVYAPKGISPAHGAYWRT